MTIRSADISYVATYFEYPTLTQIHSKPTYTTLRELKQQIKENDSVVTGNLGGGTYGHLGLARTRMEYINVNLVVYTHPT